MNVKIQSRRIRPSQNLKKLIDRQARKVRRLLPTFAPHDVQISVNLERHSTGKQYHTALVLTLPQRAIRVDDIEDNVSTSILRAFDELVRRVKKFKSRLNREKYWHKDVAAAAPVIEERTEIDQAIQDNLEKIENYFRREIYHQAILQGIPPGIVQPQALVDQLFLEMTATTQPVPENLSTDQWMFRVARRVLQKSIEEARDSGQMPHIEEPSQVDQQWDDEELNFHQPDEALRLEDLLQDNNVSTPEEFMAREETEQSLQKSIAHLPDPIREVFVLFALEGFNSDEVAMITGKAPNEVLNEVHQAREILRRELEGRRV